MFLSIQIVQTNNNEFTRDFNYFLKNANNQKECELTKRTENLN